ncbi:MAG: AraC family transcriptional regulator [Bacteroidota bacterium]
MLLHEFPDLSWIQRQSKSNFQNRETVKGTMERPGWPNVIMNTSSWGCERRGIQGPLSLFTNITGEGWVTRAGRTSTINSNVFCLSNHGAPYDLILPEKQSTTTFNIHFGEDLVKQAFSLALQSTEDQLECSELSAGHVNFSNRTFWTSQRVRHYITAIQQLGQLYQKLPDYSEKENELLLALLIELLSINELDLKGLNQFESLKRSTKVEIHARLSIAIDYLHAHWNETISSEELAMAACMSKFHFLRCFKQVFGQSPRQYQMQIRLDAAKRALSYSRQSIIEIARAVGYAEPNSFHRLFTKTLGISAQQYRAQYA